MTTSTRIELEINPSDYRSATAVIQVFNGEVEIRPDWNAEDSVVDIEGLVAGIRIPEADLLIACGADPGANPKAHLLTRIAIAADKPDKFDLVRRRNLTAQSTPVDQLIAEAARALRLALWLIEQSIDEVAA